MDNQITAPLDVSEKSIFSNVEKFEQVKYMADYLATSDMVPDTYQNKPANILIALSMAERMRADPMMVMQNLVIIHGRPSWSSQFLIASVNSSGRFSPIKYEEEEGGAEDIQYESWYQKKKTVKTETVKNDSCRAYATELSSGEVVFGPWISVGMAVKEGWYSKNGSKWKTLTQLMLQYRAAAFFVRTKAPEITMGMHTDDEVRDMGPVVVDITPAPDKKKVLSDLASLQKKPAKKKAPVDSGDQPRKEKPVEEAADEFKIDMVQFMKTSIDRCSTLKDLKECGKDISVKNDEGEFTEAQLLEVKRHYDVALKAFKSEAEADPGASTETK